MADIDTWTQELAAFARALRLRQTPRLYIRERRFQYLGSPLSWQKNCWGVAGWSFITREYFIIIAKGALSLPEEARRYLLLHELGHIKRRHSRIGIILVLLVIAIFVCVCDWCPQPYISSILAMLFGLLGIPVLAVWAPRSEHQADDVSCAVIGDQATLDGMRAISAAQGTERLRLSRMRPIERRMRKRSAGVLSE